MLIKLNIVLMIMVIISALGVVASQTKARKLFVMLEHEKQTEQQLEIEWGRLQLEQSTLVMHDRVERIAHGQLQMQLPAAKQIQILSKGRIIDWPEQGESQKP